MARISISEAARQAGISRQYFYTKMIKTGKVTVIQDEAGNPCIDESELLRACDGRLPMVKQPSTKSYSLQAPVAVSSQSKNVRSFDGLQVEVELLRERLSEKNEEIRKAGEREQRLLDQVDKLADTLKQIEHKQGTEPVKRWWNKKLW